MDLKWFEDLVVLLEEKSFTRAAARRHVTQPAFSRRIRLLEEWLGVDIINRTTKPIQMLPAGNALEESARDLVNRIYALRSNLQASTQSPNRVTFVAQHTLAISLFPRLIRQIKQSLPTTAYRVNPENYEECESAFLKEAHFLLVYETPYYQFDFSRLPVRRLALGSDKLIPVVSRGFAAGFENQAEMLADILPLLMYQQGGFLADALTNTCLPAVMRDYRVEVICESAFSASLKEMVLADMGVAWLAQDIVRDEIKSEKLISLAAILGSAELDVVLYFHEDNRSEQARQVYQLIEQTLLEKTSFVES
jgi:DNA-binding transcriptional LysR family regulator